MRQAVHAEGALRSAGDGGWPVRPECPSDRCKREPAARDWPESLENHIRHRPPTAVTASAASALFGRPLTEFLPSKPRVVAYPAGRLAFSSSTTATMLHTGVSHNAY